MTGSLPAILPVFAVPGALLLPGGRLPLTVFEPRYLAMTDDALGAGRLLALVQPTASGDGPAPGLYSVGVLARIVAFGETGDGRYLITCQGISRFRVIGEVEGRSGYRRVHTDYSPYAADLAGEPDPVFDRRRLLGAVTACLAQNGLASDRAKLDASNDRELITTVAMAAPLSPEEKQALLEAPSLGERARMMIAIFEMAVLSEAGETIRH
ncbi:MAG: LON peptidase substrate-binding domain-containing protein [Magnetospirillum sp.]